MIANYGLDAEDVQKQVSSLITGETAGKVFEGDRKFDIVVPHGPKLGNRPREALSDSCEFS